jgi:parvulin-like peptidyl-prolyl isomerase
MAAARILVVIGLIGTGCEREPPQEMDAGPVVASIGSRNITTIELREELPPFRAGPNASTLDHRRRALDRLVALELSERFARDRGLLEDPRYLERAQAIEREAHRRKQETLRRILGEDLVREYVPTEEEVQTYYAQSHARFQTSRIHLREIVTASESAASQAKEEISAGTPVEEVVARHSIAPSASKGGRIGPFEKGLVPGHLAPHVHQLGLPGDLVGPFPTPRGWTLVVLDKRETEVPRELDRVRPTVERILQRQEMQKRYERLMEEGRQRFGVSVDEAVLANDALFESR